MTDLDKNINILAIETSCDETSASIIEVEYSKSEIRTPKISSNIVSSQIDLHAKTGGVVPEVASRAHLESILPVIKEALRQEKLEDITHIAVTAGPGLIGSLLVGFNTAKALAYSLNLPIIPINHIEGHIYSAFGGESPISNFQFPIIALTVSGGHTSLTLMKDHGVYENVGQTLDDAAGEAFDKVAKLLELGYPGGPVVSKFANKFRDEVKSEKSKVKSIEFPRPIINDGTFNFSFSGLKTAVLTYVKKLSDKGKRLTDNDKLEICYAFEEAAVDVLVTKTLKAAEKYQPKAVILAGGVAANKHLRERLAEEVKNLNSCHSELVSESQNNLTIQQYNNIELLVPPITLCGDNAAMIGLAAYYHILKNDIKTWDQISVDSNLKL